MNIRADSIVVANERNVSFEVPQSELAEAVALRALPADFPEPTIRGAAVLDLSVGPAELIDGVIYRRVRIRHPLDAKSRVTSAPLKKLAREAAQSAKAV